MEDVALEIWRRVFLALLHVHSRGVIHRDLHSKNVMVCHSAIEQSTFVAEHLRAVKLADFGKASMRRNASANIPRPTYTARTAGGCSIAPEVVFRRASIWTPTGKRTRDREPEYAVSGAPGRCAYDEKIDTWASGMLLLEMVKGRIYEGTSDASVGKSMVAWFGCVPRDVVTRYNWSVPAGWISEECSDAASIQRQLGQRTKLGFASGSLLWQEQVTRALTTLSYDPAARPDRL